MADFSRALIPGVYTTVRDSLATESTIEAGVAEEKVKAIEGTHWRMTLIYLDGGNIITNTTCDEKPEMNSLLCFREGVEKTMDNKVYGGKATALFNVIADNTYKTVYRMDGVDDYEVIEEFTKEGLVVKNTEGKLVDKWTRESSEVGWFKIVREENFPAFNKAQGNPPEFEARAKERKVWVNTTETEMIWVENMGPLTIHSRFTIGEWGEYLIPNSPGRSRKILVTKEGDRKYLVVAKGEDGAGEEWIMTFTDEGMVYEGTETRTGVTCKIWTELFDNPSGKYRMVGNGGDDAVVKKMGIPDEMLEKMKNDIGCVLTVTEEGGKVRVISDSKVMPMDVTYNFGEEFEQPMPGTEEMCKVLETMEGNVITSVAKCSTGVTTTTFTFTNKYGIMETRMDGCEEASIVLYERI